MEETTAPVLYQNGGAVIDADKLKALRSKFPAKDVYKRPGPAGMRFSYIPWAKVAQRLNAAFGENGWTFTYLHAPKVDGDEVVVGTRLQCPLGVFDAYASKKRLANNKNANLGDDIQAATSQALKRAAARMGIGLELYLKEEEIVEVPEEILQTQAALRSVMTMHEINQVQAIELLTPVYGLSKAVKDMKGVVSWVMQTKGLGEMEAIWDIIDALRERQHAEV